GRGKVRSKNCDCRWGRDQGQLSIDAKSRPGSAPPATTARPICKESQIVTTNPQNKQSISYVSPNTYSPQTKNASCAGFHEFAETGFTEDRKSEAAEGAKSHHHRCKLRHWAIHLARARTCRRRCLH